MHRVKFKSSMHDRQVQPSAALLVSAAPKRHRTQISTWSLLRVIPTCYVLCIDSTTQYPSQVHVRTPEVDAPVDIFYFKNNFKCHALEQQGLGGCTRPSRLIALKPPARV